MTRAGVARRLAAGGLALLASVSAVGCSNGSSSLRARKAMTVRGSGIVNASYTAAVTGKRVTLMVPSGRVDLVVTSPRSTVPAESVANAAPLTAAPGHVLVGVSWVLQRAAYPDSPNRQLTDPRDIFGAPQPVQLWLVTDGTRRAIPHVGTLTGPSGRPNTAVWMSLPTGVRTWQFQLSYDGVTQTVDARTGKVDAGRAAALYRPLPLDHRGACNLAGKNIQTYCLTKYAVGYPYVSAAGWAAPGKTWLLLQISLEGDFGGAQQVTVAGVKPRHQIGSDPDQFSPFLVAAGARSLPVRGTATADDLYRGTVQAALTGRLRGTAS